MPRKTGWPLRISRVSHNYAFGTRGHFLFPPVARLSHRGSTIASKNICGSSKDRAEIKDVVAFWKQGGCMVRPPGPNSVFLIHLGMRLIPEYPSSHWFRKKRPL